MTRMLTLPGITVSIGQMVDALTEIAGERWRADPVAAGSDDPEDRRRLAGAVRRQAGLRDGSEPDADVGEIIRAHIEDGSAATSRSERGRFRSRLRSWRTQRNG